MGSPVYYLLREDEFAVVEEATYGVSASDPVAGDFFKHTSTHVGVGYDKQTALRDQDRDNDKASVTEMFTGRAVSPVSIDCDIIPNGNTSTPTQPDVKKLLKAAFGSIASRTAHTTTTTGSTGATLNLTAGGVAASGIAVNDLIAVNVSSSVGVEVRQVIGIASDVLTLCRALTANPASGRAVYVPSAIVKLSESALISLHLWLFNNGLKYEVPGVIVNEANFSIGFGEGVPKLKGHFGGMGMPEQSQSKTRPTPTTSGSPLTPSVGKCWIGTNLHRFINCSLNVKNGIELRNSESDSLVPTGVKRTGNNSRYAVEAALEFLMTTGTRDTQVLYDGGKTFTALDTIVQIGDAVGAIVAWRLPKWKPRSERGEHEGEAMVRLTGRAFGVSGDDEVTLAVF